MSFDNLDALSARKGFNAAVRHINKNLDFINGLSSGLNLADLLFKEKNGAFSGDEAAMALRLLLIEKMGYSVRSVNLRSTVADPAALAKEFETWKAVDLVAAYHHPELGLVTANPKNADQLAAFGELRKNELLVIYAGKGGGESNGSCGKALELAIALFEGRKVKAPPVLLKGPFTVQKKRAVFPQPKTKPAVASAAAPAAARGKNARGKPAPPETSAAAQVSSPSGLVKITPRYAVVVRNELFHNGNVEAWKRIVESYKAKYPGLNVFIYYEGERIHDINALFKWGKVKHGSAIEFAVAGSEIKDVAKLQRYLAQGASRQFEDFLRGPVGGILTLF
jgi:hypothetical protein